VFTPAGEVLFTSARPDPALTEQPADAPAALWLLPAGGEPYVVGTRPGGVADPVVARTAGTVVATAMTLPTAVTAEDDEARRKDHRERKVTAILHAGYPVRYWDADLGPDEPRLVVASVSPDGPVTWTDLTPVPGESAARHLLRHQPRRRHGRRDLADPGPGRHRAGVARRDRRGHRRAPDAGRRPAFELAGPVVSPDGRQVVCRRESFSAPTTPPTSGWCSCRSPAAIPSTSRPAGTAGPVTSRGRPTAGRHSRRGRPLPRVPGPGRPGDPADRRRRRVHGPPGRPGRRRPRAAQPSTLRRLRFLYFPDENHWILTAQNAVTWYETVLAFLDHHVRGEPRSVPDVLR